MSSKLRHQIDDLFQLFSIRDHHFVLTTANEDTLVFNCVVENGDNIISEPKHGDDHVENLIINYIRDNITVRWNSTKKAFCLSSSFVSMDYFKSKILDFICKNLENVVEPTKTTLYKYFRKRDFDDTEYEIWKYIMFHDKENEEQHTKNIMGLLKLIRKKKDGGKKANQRRR